MSASSVNIALDENKQPEVFYSLQGEGPHTGRPSIFIRLSECNLYCQWCDTPYTWNWQHTPYQHQRPHKYVPHEEQQQLDHATLLAAIKALPGSNLVISGGEPLVQQKRLRSLLALLFHADESCRIDVETNGTICPVAGLDRFISCYVVSPKLANANVPVEKRIRPDVLGWFARSDKAYFKFVVSTEADMQELRDLTRQYEIADSRVYLMPAADSLAQLNDMQTRVGLWALQQGFRFSDRLHLRLFGNGRGV